MKCMYLPHMTGCETIRFGGFLAASISTISVSSEEQDWSVEIGCKMQEQIIKYFTSENHELIKFAIHNAYVLIF